MKLKFEEIDAKMFEEYRRVLVFSHDYIEFSETENLRYFTMHEMQNVLEDYMKLFRIFGKQKLPYLFIFNFPYENKSFSESAHYIEIVL